MVLSNKKLKQKLRAELLAKSVNGTDPGDKPDPTSQTQSLRELLGAATRKPRLSKREKRRRIQSSEDLKEKVGDVEGSNGSISGYKSENRKKSKVKGSEVEEQGGKVEEETSAELNGDDGEKKKKKRKIKREEGEEAGTGNEVKESENKKDKKKKTKKKGKKEKNEGENNDTKEQWVQEMDEGNDR